MKVIESAVDALAEVIEDIIQHGKKCVSKPEPCADPKPKAEAEPQK